MEEAEEVVRGDLGFGGREGRRKRGVQGAEGGIQRQKRRTTAGEGRRSGKYMAVKNE